MTSVNELLLDEAIRHQVALSGYNNQTVKRMISILNRADARLYAALTAALERMDPASFTVERLESLLGSVRAVNSAAYAEIGDALKADLQDFARYEVSYQLQMLESALPVSVHVATVNADQIYAAALSRPFQGVLLKGFTNDKGEYVPSVIERGGMDRAKKIRQTIAQGLVENRTTAQIVRDLRGTKARGYEDGLMAGSRRDVEAVTRTALGHMAGFVQDRTTEANVSLIKALRWSSHLDLRTTPTCFPASTLALPVGDIRCVSRRFWKGDMVVVTTSSGKQLKATPNHPVLTSGGWRAIGELRPGRDVLHRICVDVAGISTPKDVEMPTTFGALADALNEPSAIEVLVESTSHADFHGDGMLGEHEIYTPNSKGDLRLMLESKLGKDVAKKLLIFVAGAGLLSSSGLLNQLVNGLDFIDMASKLGAIPVNDGVKARFAYSGLLNDVERLNSGFKHLNDLGLVPPGLGLPSFKGGHDAGALEDSCDCRSADVVSDSDACGRLAVSVLADDVVSVEREFFAGHVYNLSTSTELYIADGFIVHNCRIRDGKLYEPESHKPIGHSLPWGAGPGRAHWACRSAQIYVMKSNAELGIDAPDVVMKGGTRASMDGQLPKDTTYGEWLAKQSAARQDEVLGPTRAKLLRDGKLPMEAMYSQRGQFLTIEELRVKDAEAFKRAGI